MRRLILSLVVGAAIGANGIAYAQSGQTGQIPLQFDFLNPGARSLGIGSAFVAIADDATSAFTNPAGLTRIGRTEVSAELRYRRLDTRYLAGGRLSGDATFQGIDTIVGPAYGTSQDSAFRPYFLSLVYPYRRWSFAGYRHELVRQSNPFLSQGPLVQLINGTSVDNNGRMGGLVGNRSISIDNYGVSVGYRLSERVALGAGLAIYRFNTESDFATLSFSGGGQFAPADLNSRGLNSTTTQSGTDVQPGLNAGVLIAVNPNVRIGAVFRQGASFHFQHTTFVPGDGTQTKTGRFRTPTVVGAGIRLHPANPWSFAFDFDFVQYSRLRDDFIAFQVAPKDLPTIGVKNGVELHFGAEYTLLALPHAPSIRLGAWYDPSHSVHYATNLSNSADDIRLRSIFPASEDLWHFTIGAGLPLSDDYELNVGADFTRARRYFSTSIVARFGR